MAKRPKTIRVELPVLPANSLGGLHMDLASAEFPDGTKARVSGGFGLGNSQMYVAIDGKRRLAVDSAPLLRALINAAVDLSRAPSPSSVEPRRGGTAAARRKERHRDVRLRN